MAYLAYNGKPLMRMSKWLDYSTVGPTLPPYTIRLKYTYGAVPQFRNGTAVQVSASPNIWDLTYQNSDWSYLLYQHQYLLEVIDANTTGVNTMGFMFRSCPSLRSVHIFDTSNCTSMTQMFGYCYNLTSVPLFDTSSVELIGGMFQYCRSLTSVPLFDTSSAISTSQMFYECPNLTSVPLFDTSSVYDMSNMFGFCSRLTSVPLFDTSNCTSMAGIFKYCYNVESGALALYQQASTQTNVPRHTDTFLDCGSQTVTGAQELAQIPTSWGGTMA